MSVHRLLLLTLLLTACGIHSEPPRVSPASPRVQAALAMLTVENRTASSLTISFRDADRTRGIVSIGVVPPGETRKLAPVSAAEPIILSARRAEGGTLELPARTFTIDEQWRWVIPADAAFRR